ncbi:hypothetical protein GOP47_0021127 [Adiantum capillus-veneris]|uniref:Allene oxide synthase n=1 Tax=Adiantum capillus-veneris TaxID=13818 RepID=A0A9D4UAX6_ADICA|nr:hypothetical protein GOP47_0020521 [Adiantum capillus-veneris]KAI5064457.1 hypothetical protein GOP47_0021127 [Adiantum capillus-veneris]
MGSKASSDIKTPMIFHQDSSDELPLKTIPGSYGMPFFGPIKDRLDFFWFQGQTKFWTSRMEKYQSTVFHVNVAPGPPGFRTSHVVMLLDQKSFPILFDVSKVEKKDVLLANYMPSLSLFGGTRPCVFLDPSEELHAKVKSFVMNIIKLNASKWIPEMQKAALEVFPKWDLEMNEKAKAEVNTHTSQVACNVLVRTVLGRDPAAPGEATLKTDGPSLFRTWLAPFLAPIASIGLPHILEELTFHSFPIPSFVASGTYKKLTNFFEIYGTELLDMAEREHGIDRHEALHNIIFFMGFNAFGGLQLFLPAMVEYVAGAGQKLHDALVKEVRDAVKEEGGSALTVAALRRMELSRSIVYESLRMSPPVAYQYARAKEDITVESHDARYEIKKGELIGGCQPVATRDPRVFKDAEKFVAERFMGEEGKKLIKYVLWGNGPADGKPSVSNKQCAANDLVPLLSQAFLACLFLHYDSFTIFKPTIKGNSVTIHFSSLRKAC